MREVGPLLSTLFKELGVEPKIKLHMLQSQWLSLFNEPLSLHTYPVEMKEGELTINVDSPLWLQQLKYHHDDIRDKLTAYQVLSIRLKHGRVYHKKTEGQKSSRKRLSATSRSLTNSDMVWISEVISSITDPELQEEAKKAIQESLLKNKKKAGS